MRAANDVSAHDPNEYRMRIMTRAIDAVIGAEMVNARAGVVDVAPALNGLADAIAYIAHQDPQYKTRHGAKRLAREVARTVEETLRVLDAIPQDRLPHAIPIVRS